MKPSKNILIPLSHVTLIFMKKKTRKIVKDRLQKSNQNFLNLVFGFFTVFPKSINSKKVIRIHGKKDQFFPFKKINNLKYVLPGGHFLLDHYPKELSVIIKKELN